MKILLILLLAVFLNAGEEIYQADKKMTWQHGVDYCFSIGGRLPSIKQLKIAFKNRNKEYEVSSYWTETNIDIDGAYSFDFELGLPMPDHKAKRYLIMCVN